MNASIRKVACRLVLLLAILCAPQIGHAQELSKKERSERINLKTYSDAEWESLERAVAANLAACDNGDAQSCKTAGDAYVSGDGVWPVPAIAYILFKEACDAGVGAGCRAFVELAGTGYGYPEGGYEETAGLMERACDLGDLIGCDKFADELRTNSLNPSDLARSDAILESACEAGGEEACLSLSSLLMESGQSEDDARAIDMLDEMCRQSVLSACQTIASRLKYQSEPEEWRVGQYQHIACYLESASECMDMGERVYKGIGVAKDRDLALVYYDKACQIEAGYCEISAALRELPALRSACTPDDAQACAKLGKALALVLSPEADRETALELLVSSCRNGIGEACNDAAGVIEQKYSFDDPDRSALLSEMLERGCEADNFDACFTLARALEAGRLGTTNVERAVELYSRLCDAEYPDACAMESKFAGIVPAARIAVADQSFTPPAVQGNATNLARDSGLLYCLTASEQFRGQTFTWENCERTERGIGSYRLRPGQAPWQALLWRPEILNGQRLGLSYRVLCGGSLIARGWILTAAHCLEDEGMKVASPLYSVRLGVFNPRADEGITYPIVRTIIHPSYRPETLAKAFDIALIQYDPRRGDQVGPVNAIAKITLDPLAIGIRTISEGMDVYSYGWGWTTHLNGESTDYLQGVKMQLRSEDYCTEFITKFRDAKRRNVVLCAGGANSEQTCEGDSGGPLVYYGDRSRRPTLIGVVSAGEDCGNTGLESRYTRIAKVKEWIDSHVGPD